MKRIIIILISTFLLLLTLGAGTLYWIFQSQYASTFVNQVFQQLSLPVTVLKARYHFPNQLTFSGIDIKEVQEEEITIEKADIWFTPSSLLTGKPVIESLLIDGISLQHGIPEFQLPDTIELKQLAVMNLDYSDNEIIGRDIELQIKNPQFNQNPIPVPYGTIQLSAGQIYWKGEALNNLLVDIDYTPEKSTLYGLSFDWRKGKFSGQAEKYSSGWSLVNFTVENLRLNQQDWQHLNQLGLKGLTSGITHINSLDMLSSSVETPEFSVINFDLSLENIDLTKSRWQQSEGYLSLSSESIEAHKQQLIDPVFKLFLNRGEIELNEFSAEFQQGDINASGTFSPDSIKMERLSLNSLKWFPESAEDTRIFTDTLAGLQELDLNEFEIKHSQFIELNGKHKWQASGLNLEGKNLSIIRDGNWGLWSGELDISSSSISIDELVSSQPMMKMKNRDGIWLLEDLFVPLDDGLIEATGDVDLSKISKPWRLELSADGVPLELLSHWYNPPVKLTGLTEFQLSASGLSGDELMLRHSLSSDVIGSFRNTTMTNQDEDEARPATISDIRISAVRGHISMKPVEIEGYDSTGVLSANIDLVEKEQNSFNFQLKKKCVDREWDLLKQTETMRISCSIDEP
ncbi:AsmA family protein [Vibrio sp. JC009]|uniref:AsmA family protein n=1 Tax=Vibrio sp. JC009 TaxID=2912314 RepID=UPI0023B1B547|nr:AsmA family protein [Vibrio sp. JC009]WED21920.1 AsmA family protein [Vibrio sp. JC009]